MAIADNKKTGDISEMSKVSKILMYFGFVGLIISIIDIIDLLFPLKLADKEWIFITTNTFINSLMVPILCIVLLLAGIYFVENYATSKLTLLKEKILSFISFAFALLVAGNLILYSLSIQAYQTSVVNSVNAAKDNIIKQIDSVYQANKEKVTKKQYDDKINEINQQSSSKVDSLKSELFKKNLKIIIEDILYLILFSLMGKIAFSSSKRSLLKLKFAEREQKMQGNS